MFIEAILTPDEIARLPQRDLSDATCIVFDVLRATSTMLTALANGARRIHPVSTIEEAWSLKHSHLPDALLGGERGGVRIEGFDLGNSPGEYAASVVAGRELICTTTNGTVALRACTGAKQVLAGAWLNLDALAAWLLDHPKMGNHLVLVGAGTGQKLALEDALAVGGLIARLHSKNGARCETDDAARLALALFESMGADSLAAFGASENGRRLVEIGLAADVEYCASTTALPWLARLHEGAMVGEFVG